MYFYLLPRMFLLIKLVECFVQRIRDDRAHRPAPRAGHIHASLTDKVRERLLAFFDGRKAVVRDNGVVG